MDLRMLDEDIKHLASDRSVQVGFLGDFSSGKSTLINELTGVDDLMPTQLEPCTARAGEVVSTPDLDAPEYSASIPTVRRRRSAGPTSTTWHVDAPMAALAFVCHRVRGSRRDSYSSTRPDFRRLSSIIPRSRSESCRTWMPPRSASTSARVV